MNSVDNQFENKYEKRDEFEWKSIISVVLSKYMNNFCSFTSSILIFYFLLLATWTKGSSIFVEVYFGQKDPRPAISRGGRWRHGGPLAVVEGKKNPKRVVRQWRRRSSSNAAEVFHGGAPPRRRSRRRRNEKLPSFLHSEAKL